MARSSVIVALFAILPGLAAGQESRTHTVVAGNTLWAISSQYLGDPFKWPLLYEANRDRIENPHRIYPGWVVRIPDGGAAAAVLQVSVQPGPPGNVSEPPPPPPAPVQAMPSAPLTTTAQLQQTPAVQQVAGRTVFFRASSQGNVAPPPRTLMDVAPDQFYSAPWLIPPGTVPESTGTLTAFDVDPEKLARSANSARPFDRLHVAIDGALPGVGSRLQVFRVERDVEDVGHVVMPTGILVVETIATDGVVASVETQFGRVLLGDLVRPLPPFTPVTTDALIDATTGMEATVLSYAAERGVQQIGGYAFLNVGSDDGVRIGDEYVVLGGANQGFPGQVQGRVKIVSVLPEVSTAQIIGLENPVFVPGVRLRPDRRVR